MSEDPASRDVAAEREKPIGLRERARRERYARIRKAAQELFAEKGYSAVTTREVAQRAEVGEATLFRYIANKEELLLLVVGERVDALVEQVLEADRATVAAPHNPSDGEWYLARIYALYEARVAYFQSDPEHVANYLSYGLKSDNALGAQSTASGDRVINLVQSILSSAQAAGVIRGDVAANIVARNCNGIYIHEILRIPSRRLSVEGTWDRLRERFDVMLRPLLIAS
ncbi:MULTISPECIES: TetR/AcrR family transcriptional regulator [Microbacterium]|uniref:TetR/AcrR family transcriptional regulator n=1 Tax=Microbacterium TaxID=33882 RepID=UPI001D17868A|nr:TetR/AcrR family transcriptional regulator [Microbacterium testaceum]MCC4250190.1 TetR/AcrR family transcriptional regulator; helix-turn-helix transcriptional regulator [Microbacterium testaceum]